MDNSRIPKQIPYGELSGAHMDNSRIPKQIPHGELSGGTRNVGQPKLRFKDQCKMSMMEFSTNVANWDMVVQDRVGWRAAVFMGARRYEENRVQCAVENRQRRKCPTVDDSTVFCYCRHSKKPCRLCMGCFSFERRCVPR